jgi:hypothetical protein
MCRPGISLHLFKGETVAKVRKVIAIQILAKSERTMGAPIIVPITMGREDCHAIARAYKSACKKLGASPTGYRFDMGGLFATNADDAIAEIKRQAKAHLNLEKFTKRMRAVAGKH